MTPTTLLLMLICSGAAAGVCVGIIVGHILARPRRAGGRRDGCAPGVCALAQLPGDHELVLRARPPRRRRTPPPDQKGAAAP